MKKSSTKTKNATGIMNVTTEMGDKFNDKWKKSDSNSDAKITLASYKVALTAAKHQAMYRKEKGDKRKISFFD